MGFETMNDAIKVLKRYGCILQSDGRIIMSKEIEELDSAINYLMSEWDCELVTLPQDKKEEGK